MVGLLLIQSLCLLLLSLDFLMHGQQSKGVVASVKKLKQVLLSLTVPGNVPGLERAYQALGITLATNGEPRLQPYPGKKSETLWFQRLFTFAVW